MAPASGDRFRITVGSTRPNLAELRKLKLHEGMCNRSMTELCFRKTIVTSEQNAPRSSPRLDRSKSDSYLDLVSRKMCTTVPVIIK